MGFSGKVRGQAAVIVVTIAAALGVLSRPALAHVGSPDIYVEGNAGPYRLLVTVRPPLVIPGVAEIEVRAVGAASDIAISGIAIAPIPLTGEASKHPPVADAMKQGAGDKEFYTGSLWIMASGSWQVRFTVEGNKGSGVFSVPVPATSSATLGMQTGMGILLSGLGLVLVAGVVGIVGAAARDAQLPPGVEATGAGRKRAWIAMGVALVLVAGLVVFGKVWWGDEAEDYSKYVYKPLTMTPALTSSGMLRLEIRDPGWLKSRKVDDFVPDHDHLMHLYLIRQPGMDAVFHLHPELVAGGEFQLAMPTVPAGEYRLYADVVHATGFPETLVARMTLPEGKGRALAGDDAEGLAAALSPLQGVGAACPATPALGARFLLPDGYSMVWTNAGKIAAKKPEIFAFRLLDATGNPATDMALYMGMQGHAAFVKDDGTVFAHVHPSGTASMAALMMAAIQNQPSGAKSESMAGMKDMDSDDDSDGDSTKPAKQPLQASREIEAPAGTEVRAGGSIPNAVGFPYGFPAAGAYRIFVQMKHGQTVETGAFDACAEPAAMNAN